MTHAGRRLQHTHPRLNAGCVQHFRHNGRRGREEVEPIILAADHFPLHLLDLVGLFRGLAQTDEFTQRGAEFGRRFKAHARQRAKTLVGGDELPRHLNLVGAAERRVSRIDLRQQLTPEVRLQRNALVVVALPQPLLAGQLWRHDHSPLAALDLQRRPTPPQV